MWHGRVANTLPAPGSSSAVLAHGTFRPCFSGVGHKAFPSGISVSTAHGTFIPISCGLNIVRRSWSLLYRDFDRFTIGEASLFCWNRQTFGVPRQSREFTQGKLPTKTATNYQNRDLFVKWKYKKFYTYRASLRIDQKVRRPFVLSSAVCVYLIMSFLQNDKSHRVSWLFLMRMGWFMLAYRAIARNLDLHGDEIPPSGRNDRTCTVHFAKGSYQNALLEKMKPITYGDFSSGDQS